MILNHPNCIFIFLFKTHFVTQLKRKLGGNVLLILFTSQKMQLYSENEKSFLLIHFNLNYVTDVLL